ncbi:MAG: DUF2971 domain-containing protein [Erysipelotrichaceae bacterium]|nr:DUF2971 domain-containing protein [Erysipelotrichaceae bacterium]
MKIEDIKIDLTPQEVNEQSWNKEQWIKDNPVNYFKFLRVLQLTNNGLVINEIMKTVYRITRLYLPNILYKYYSLSNDHELNEKKFDTLLNKRIFMSDLKDFNDPFDGKGYFYLSEELAKIDQLKQCNGKIIDDFSSFTKCTSLTSNGINSMPMWAHYGSNHTGFCVSYDMNDKENIDLISNSFPVQYIDERIDITSMMKDYMSKICNQIASQDSLEGNKIIIDDLSLVYMSILFTNLKHQTWSYENEFRCIIGSNAPGVPFINAKPKEIFIGMNCDFDSTTKLKSIANHLGAEAYKMTFDEYNESYNLIPVLL